MALLIGNPRFCATNEEPPTLHLGQGSDLTGLRWRFEEMVDAGHREIVVDLHDAQRLDSDVLTALLVAHRACRARGGAVVLSDPSPDVREQLHDGGFTTVFPVVEMSSTTDRSGRGGRRTGARFGTPTDVEPVVCRSEHDVNGWELAAASGADVTVRVRRSREALAVTLADPSSVGSSSRSGADGPDVERTVLVLGSDGQCHAKHHCSPSLIHISADGGEVTTISDVEGALLLVEEGSVVVAPTSGLLELVPPKELTRLRRRVRRRHRIEDIARDLVRSSGQEGSSTHSGALVIRRGISRSARGAHAPITLQQRRTG